MTGTRLDRPAPPTARRQGARAATIVHGIGRVAAVAAGALVLGGLTSPAQGVLPEWLGGFANSSGGWSILVFALVLTVRARPALSAVLGAVAFVLLVEGYRIVSGWRGFPYDEPFQNVFTILGLLVGPVIGVSAALLRASSPTRRTLAVVPLSTVLVGEGLYGLVVLDQGPGAIYWVLQLVLGAGFLAWGTMRTRSSVPSWVPVVTAGSVVALSILFVVAYTALPRLLM